MDVFVKIIERCEAHKHNCTRHEAHKQQTVLGRVCKELLCRIHIHRLGRGFTGRCSEQPHMSLVAVIVVVVEVAQPLVFDSFICDSVGESKVSIDNYSIETCHDVWKSSEQQRLPLDSTSRKPHQLASVLMEIDWLEYESVEAMNR